MAKSTSVEGAGPVRRAFRDMAADVGDTKPADVAAERARDRARQLVPRRSGALSDSIRVESLPTGAELVAGSSSVPYAGVIEYGWPARHIAAQPYMRPTVTDDGRELVEPYTDHIDGLMRRFDRRTPG